MLSLSFSCEVGRSAGGDGGSFGRGRPGDVWSGRQSIVIRGNACSRQKVWMTSGKISPDGIGCLSSVGQDVNVTYLGIYIVATEALRPSLCLGHD